MTPGKDMFGQKVEAKAPTAGQREQMARILSAAFAGNLAWVHEAVVKAGYEHPGEGLAVAELVRRAPALSRPVLANWELDGLAIARDGGKARVKPLDLVAYLHNRFIRPGRPMMTGGGGGLVEEQTRATRYQADLREIQVRLSRGELVKRAEAEGVLAKLVLQVSSMLWALPSRLAPQLAHHDMGTIRRTLAAHVQWILNLAAKHRIPVSHAAAGAVRAILKDALAEVRKAVEAAEAVAAAEEEANREDAKGEEGEG